MKDRVIGQGHRLLSDLTVADMPIRGIYYTWRKFNFLPDKPTTMVEAIIYRNGHSPARMSFGATGDAVTLSIAPEEDPNVPFNDIVELLVADVANL